MLKTDNGKNFTSNEVKVYCQANGIKIVNSLPYNPRANGSVERSHPILKVQLLRLLREKYELKGNLLSFEEARQCVQNAAKNCNRRYSSATLYVPDI